MKYKIILMEVLFIFVIAQLSMNLTATYLTLVGEVIGSTFLASYSLISLGLICVILWAWAVPG